jgi:hypothetical protein
MSPYQNSRVHALLRLGVSGLLLWSAAAAAGPAFYTGFEAPDYNGSSDGVVVTGQQGWYLPDVAGSVDQFVFTYDGNALGLPSNPFGEDQFVGGQPMQLGDLARAQLNFDWSQATVWTVSYDIATGFNGILPASDFLGSFSLQDSNIARYFIAVNGWVNPDIADHWNALYIVFDSTGLMIDPLGLSPGPAWRNLAVDHWYNQSTTFDFDSNTILSVSITDLDSGDTATFEPTGWYLAGGAVSRPPLPTALRLFVGGGDAVPGNVGGYDNLTITAVAGPAQNPGVSPNVQGIQQVKPGRVTN